MTLSLITRSFLRTFRMKCSIRGFIGSGLLCRVSWIKLVVSNTGLRSSIFLNSLLCRCRKLSFGSEESENYFGKRTRPLLERSSLMRFLQFIMNKKSLRARLLPDRISILSRSGFLICASSRKDSVAGTSASFNFFPLFM